MNDASVAAALQRDGHLDVVQLHGSEPVERCADLAQPYFKAIRIQNRADAQGIDAYRCPRVLVDAPSSGRHIDDDLIDVAAEQRPLWLAGGISPDNVVEVINRHTPELLDASSGLEISPGKKDPGKLRAFFQAVDFACRTAVRTQGLNS